MAWRYRIIGWALRHPCRPAYVLAEFFRPLSFGRKLDNAWFHVRHWGDVDAWRQFAMPRAAGGSGDKPTPGARHAQPGTPPEEGES